MQQVLGVPGKSGRTAESRGMRQVPGVPGKSGRAAEGRGMRQVPGVPGKSGRAGERMKKPASAVSQTPAPCSCSRSWFPRKDSERFVFHSKNSPRQYNNPESNKRDKMLQKTYLSSLLCPF